MNQFGGKIKELRLQLGLLQQDVASKLEIDAPMLSKIEKGIRQLKREQVQIIAEILKVKSDELITLWLADQIYAVVKDEKLAHKAMQVTEKNINLKKKNNK